MTTPNIDKFKEQCARVGGCEPAGTKTFVQNQLAFLRDISF